jgi:hypothetical protein
VASTSKKKKGRGSSRGIATAKALRASSKQKLRIILEVHRGVPVDINSDKFASELSFLVKKHATLAVSKWAEVHEESKNIIYERMRVILLFSDISLSLIPFCYIIDVILTKFIGKMFRIRSIFWTRRM